MLQQDLPRWMNVRVWHSGRYYWFLSQPLQTFAKGTQGINIGRMSIEKTFTGELSATRKGEMLNAMTSVKGSAGYVAIEQVVGSLSGKQGSFVLQHYGVMSAGNENLILEVIPDSGTGELAGLSGEMKIRSENNQHYYEFEYNM